MVTLISLPAFLTPLASLLMALFGALGVARLRRHQHIARPHDWQREVADITLKVRRPWAYRVQKVTRWMDGE